MNLVKELLQNLVIICLAVAAVDVVVVVVVWCKNSFCLPFS
jgi:hypothetical protein